MAKLSREMINNGILLQAEAHRLAAVELGVDPEKLASFAQSKRNQALENLAAIFEKKSVTLNDPEWDAEERTNWAQKVSSQLEERVTKADWEAMSFKVPVIPNVPKRSTFSALGHRCTDLSGNLMTEKEAFLEFASELGTKEPLTFDLKELLRTAPPSPQPKSPSPVSSANEQAD